MQIFKKIHVKEFILVMLQVSSLYLKCTVSHIFSNIVPRFSHFVEFFRFQIDVSSLMIKTSQWNLYLDSLALKFLYFLICTILITILVLFYNILFYTTFKLKKKLRKNFSSKRFCPTGFKNLSQNSVKTIFLDFKFSKYFRQKHRLIVVQNYFTYETCFSYLLIKTLQNLRFLFFKCSLVEASHILGVLLSKIFQIFADNKVHNHKVKKVGTIKTFKH